MNDFEKHLEEQKAKSPTFADNYERARQQVHAEIAFTRTLEKAGITPERFRKRLGISRHQYHVTAHFLYGVNDEEPY